MNIEKRTEDLMNESISRSINTKSVELKNFIDEWKKNVNKFDVGKVLSEKAVKIQTAMSI